MIEQLAIQPTDIALFLVSFAACVYCIILSRRLKTLQDTRDGLGATIMAMNKSVAAVSSATRETRVQAGELTDRLAQMMREADKSCQRLSALQASVEASEGNLGRKADAVKSEVTSEMKLILQRSREEMREMKQLLQELKAQKSRLSAADRDADFLFEDDIMPAAGGRR
ncbi:DUF6468 domain-containing protein [Henriciella pelagia]|jgi:uncharacterized protein YoxC|uniref:DUF6468 domain-containing protein n=1 Tax=Henriciella pelagia TaxID=1977912 RepID=A0ABQ1JW77_9PROT|nr:DUF6468 domain-containing protein [Henriciella pelagia]GGB75709.1 hypothetical protein GCM10011503_25530 [Henriciella pelagia]